MNMIIKEKRVPIWKTDTVCSSVPKGYCFGTLFLWVSVYMYIWLIFLNICHLQVQKVYVHLHIPIKCKINTGDNNIEEITISLN